MNFTSDQNRCDPDGQLLVTRRASPVLHATVRGLHGRSPPHRLQWGRCHVNARSTYRLPALGVGAGVAAFGVGAGVEPPAKKAPGGAQRMMSLLPLGPEHSEHAADALAPHVKYWPLLALSVQPST